MESVPYTTTGYPAEQNLAKETNYRLIIARCPKISYFCNSVNVPSVQLNTITIPTGRAVADKVPTANLSFNEALTAEFIIDEFFYNWEEIINWMSYLAGHPNRERFSTIQASDYGLTSDIDLHILTNSLNPTNAIFKYYNCFPNRLSTIKFDSTTATPRKLYCTVDFSYTHYELKRNNQ